MVLHWAQYKSWKKSEILLPSTFQMAVLVEVVFYSTLFKRYAYHIILKMIKHTFLLFQGGVIFTHLFIYLLISMKKKTTTTTTNYIQISVNPMRTTSANWSKSIIYHLLNQSERVLEKIVSCASL